MDKRKILEDIIDNNMSIREASDKYGCSISTLRRYIASLKKSNNLELIDLYNKYCDLVKSKKIDTRKILEDIVSSHLTIKEASDKYGCSISTIKKYIASLNSSNDNELLDLHKRYLFIARENEQMGFVNGGQTGKRKTERTMEEIKKLYELIIQNDYTLRELETVTGVPFTTLYDLFMKNLSSEELSILNDIFYNHRKNYYGFNDVENNSSFHNVGTSISRPVTRGIVRK